MEQFYTVNEAIGLINKARGFTWTWRDLFKAAYLGKDIGLMCYVADIPVMKTITSEDDYKEGVEYFTGYFNPLDTEEGQDYIYRLSHDIPITKGITSFEGTEDGGVYDYFVIAKGALPIYPYGEIKPSANQFYVDKSDSTYFETEEKSSVTTRGITRSESAVTEKALKERRGNESRYWRSLDTTEKIKEALGDNVSIRHKLYRENLHSVSYATGMAEVSLSNSTNMVSIEAARDLINHPLFNDAVRLDKKLKAPKLPCGIFDPIGLQVAGFSILNCDTHTSTSVLKKASSDQTCQLSKDEESDFSIVLAEIKGLKQVVMDNTTILEQQGTQNTKELKQVVIDKAKKQVQLTNNTTERLERAVKQNTNNDKPIEFRKYTINSLMKCEEYTSRGENRQKQVRLVLAYANSNDLDIEKINDWHGEYKQGATEVYEGVDWEEVSMEWSTFRRTVYGDIRKILKQLLEV